MTFTYDSERTMLNLMYRTHGSAFFGAKKKKKKYVAREAGRYNA